MITVPDFLSCRSGQVVALCPSPSQTFTAAGLLRERRAAEKRRELLVDFLALGDKRLGAGDLVIDVHV